MSETRKSDGELPKDSDNVVLDEDKDFRNSRLSLSKEKASPDGAHEKLLNKEEEAKIVRVDMVDAKYVSGDQRNGDPKIELDANKKQFSGLTKEELMKYADDPFWVNLRWCMFVLFWALWLGMLAGAIAIIVQAPKCAARAPRTWYEKGPLVELDIQDFTEVENELALLQAAKVEGLFLEVEAYDALDKPDVLDKFRKLVDKAREYSIKIVLDLTPNYVSSSHPWFVASVNKTAPYTDYFTWAPVKEFDDSRPIPPNTWVSTLNTTAWKYSEARKEFYLHQFGEEQPDLNFRNPAVKELFSGALKEWMAAGAAGVRLNKARLMLVSLSGGAQEPASGRGASLGADHTQYPFYRHTQTADQPGLDDLLSKLAADTAAAATEDNKETVFTLREDGVLPELYLLARENATRQRPPSAAPARVSSAAAAVTHVLSRINATEDGSISRWPFLQLKAESREAEEELAYFAMLLPAAPVFSLAQINNETAKELSALAGLRADPSIEHGEYVLRAVSGRTQADNSTDQLLACARWKAKHTGYVAVFNPAAGALRANLSALAPAPVPRALAVHHVSRAVRAETNYTSNYLEQADSVLVPGRSTVLLSFVVSGTAEN